ncbi:MAG: hypothetical protein AMK74_07025 [Nitrospira bacterium SM23_35]|nr:MAG: hypothetical protein AMK74_07025 [Nitrospira bacterium SM23_35]
MNLLEKKIIDKIKTEGPISFETFMHMALYEPGLGYYASEHIEIGKAGDFYTSQHVHPVFGAMIARQIEEMWELLGRPSDFSAIEPGAGAGLMCLDILHYLQNRDFFPSFTYLIVETNPSVILKQRSVLNKYAGKVRWISSLEQAGRRKGCILSNELLDAFPVHLIEMEEELREIYLDLNRQGGQSTPPFQEVNRNPHTDSLIDYLQALLCYFQHQVHENPYINIGHQDITAHVNFSSVKKWGECVGFQTIGFCRQGTYLISLGIDREIQNLLKNSADYLFEVARIKRLIFPGTLGETHKVMVQYKGRGYPQMQGFSMRNQAGTL